jgi:hypothetical protein
MIAPVRGGGAYATAHTAAMGTAAEQRFYDICRSRGYKIRAATSYENRVKHFDFHVQGRPVEVKAMKAPRRGMAPVSDMIYVELKNVSGGVGWVYGDADFIAFEQHEGFLVVDRRELVRLVQSMQPKCKQSRVSGVFHTLYSRANRDDLVMVLHKDDLARLDTKWLLPV